MYMTQVYMWSYLLEFTLRDVRALDVGRRQPFDAVVAAELFAIERFRVEIFLFEREQEISV